MDLETLYKPAPDAPSLRVERTLARTPREVWTALLDPVHATRVWFGSTLETDLRPGGFLKWTGEWKGKRFEDRAIVVACEEGVFLEALYFSGFSEYAESAETRMRMVVRLNPQGGGTKVVVEQENFADETSRNHSRGSWNEILDAAGKEPPAP